MILVLFKLVLILLVFNAVNSQHRIDNPEREFQNYLDATDKKIRGIAENYQNYEKIYRKHSRIVIRKINRTVFNMTKDLEISLKVIYLNYTKSLRKMPFAMNDAEYIKPKGVCLKAYDSIKEYESIMMIFLGKNFELTRNLSSLNYEFNRINSTNFNVSEQQRNFIVEFLYKLRNLVNVTENFITGSNQAAFNVSSVLMSLKARVMYYCGSINGITTTRRTTETFHKFFNI